MPQFTKWLDTTKLFVFAPGQHVLRWCNGGGGQEVGGFDVWAGFMGGLGGRGGGGGRRRLKNHPLCICTAMINPGSSHFACHKTHGLHHSHYLAE